MNGLKDENSIDLYSQSQYDRSSLCNHDDLMEQYKKLLTAVNTENTDQNDRLKSMMDELETDLKKSQITYYDRLIFTLYLIALFIYLVLLIYAHQIYSMIKF